MNRGSFRPPSYCVLFIPKGNGRWPCSRDPGRVSLSGRGGGPGAPPPRGAERRRGLVSARGARRAVRGPGAPTFPCTCQPDPDSGQTAGAAGARRRRVQREDGLRLGSRGAAGMRGWERGAERGTSPRPEGVEKCGASAGGESRESGDGRARWRRTVARGVRRKSEESVAAQGSAGWGVSGERGRGAGGRQKRGGESGATRGAGTPAEPGRSRRWGSCSWEANALSGSAGCSRSAIPHPLKSTNSWPLFDITPVSPRTSKSQVRPKPSPRDTRLTPKTIAATWSRRPKCPEPCVFYPTRFSSNPMKYC